MMIFPLLAAIFCLSLPNPYPTLALPAPPRPGGFPFVPQQTGGFPPFPSPAPWGNNNNNNGSYIWGNSNSGQISPNFTNNNSNNSSNKNITTSINQSSMPNNNNNSSSNMYATTFMSPRQRKANDYFAKFGYISKASSAYSVASDRIIAQFQHMAGLPESGQLDENTMAMMQSPRCGMPDIDRTYDDEEPPRFSAEGGKWSKTDLTYRVEKYTTRLTREEVDRTIAEAFEHWANVTSLTFTKKDTGIVDIVIIFQRGEHGDPYPFEKYGRGGVLAHAFYPNSLEPNSRAGDAHFDDAELWTINSFSGQNLLQVAIHEFGHSLGLGHSDDRAAVMWAFGKPYEPSLRLGDDDIRSIYGPPKGTTPTTTTTTTTTTTRQPITAPTTSTTTTTTATTTTTQTIVPSHCLST